MVGALVVLCRVGGTLGPRSRRQSSGGIFSSPAHGSGTRCRSGRMPPRLPRRGALTFVPVDSGAGCSVFPLVEAQPTVARRSGTAASIEAMRQVPLPRVCHDPSFQCFSEWRRTRRRAESDAGQGDERRRDRAPVRRGAVKAGVFWSDGSQPSPCGVSTARTISATFAPYGFITVDAVPFREPRRARRRRWRRPGRLAAGSRPWWRRPRTW